MQTADSTRDQQPSPTLTLPINLSNKCNSTNLKENQYPMLSSSLHKAKKNTKKISSTPKNNPQVCLKVILHAEKQVMSCDAWIKEK